MDISRALRAARSLIAPNLPYVIAALCAIPALYTLIARWYVFSGDAQIHLIFAQNLLAGHPLQFNKGEFSSGETSPLYMLAVAIFWLLAGHFAPLLMKALSILSLGGIAYFCYAAARRLGLEKPAALALGALPLLLPSNVFQALLGMENVFFAFCVVAILDLWFQRSDRRWFAPLLAIAIAPLALLRPEAAFLVAAIGTAALAERDWRRLGWIGGGAAVAAALYLALEWYTGVPLEAAGQMRAELARMESTTFAIPILGHHVYFAIRPIMGALYIAPFAGVLFFSRPLALQRREIIAAVFLIAVPFALFVLAVLPAIQFSRYFAFSYASFFYLFSRVIARRQPQPWGRIFAAVAALCLTLIPLELAARSLFVVDDVRTAIKEMTPSETKAQSDRLYALLGRPPLPVVIALQEVQLRARLDDRFVVRPLDGVVDDTFAAFIRSGWIDHVGYIKARHIGFVLGPQNYNRDRKAFSLVMLNRGPATSLHDGLCFRRILDNLAPYGPVYAIRPAAECGRAGHAA
jgi:hypothetical protein